MKSLPKVFWIISLLLHGGLLFYLYISFQDPGITYAPLKLDMTLTPVPLSMPSQRSSSPHSKVVAPDSSRWQIDPLNSMDFQEMGWEEATPHRRDWEIEKFKSMAISSEMDIPVPEMSWEEELSWVEENLAPPPRPTTTIQWSQGSLAGSGPPLPNIQGFGIYREMEIPFRIIIDPKGVILRIQSPETGNLELEMVLLEYVRAINFPPHPEGMEYEQVLTIKIILEDKW